MTPPSLEVVLIAARAVFLVASFIVAAVTFSGWRRATQAQTTALLASQEELLLRLTSLEAQIDATKLSVSQLGERIERPQQVASAVASAPPGYQIAIRLARSGATAEELTSGCGLSIHEAELIQRLHGPKRSRAGRSAAQPHAA